MRSSPVQATGMVQGSPHHPRRTAGLDATRQQGEGGMSAEQLPTRLSLRGMRADALHRLLLSPRGRVDTVDDIPRLSDLFSWPGVQVQAAIGDLVHDGLL